jgi:hypothetical protein
MPKVDFEVKPSSGIKGFWIAVGKDDVPLVNGKGSINLPAGEEQILIWWFVGDEGKSISITGTLGQKTVVEVKESKIPKGRVQSAGAKIFNL